jgi:riboflavin synthase
MFTGVVEEVGYIKSLVEGKLTINTSKIIRKLSTGDSVDVNGICLTVTGFDSASFTVDVMEETLGRTNLKYLKKGDPVNLELALTLQKPLGGHLVEGHVDSIGEILTIDRYPESNLMVVSAPPYVMGYIVEKGFIAIDGISLTVASRTASSFTVSIVNFTWVNTRLNSLKPSDRVNLEIDIIAKYVKQFLTSSREAISMDMLKEHGFLAS